MSKSKKDASPAIRYLAELRSRLLVVLLVVLAGAIVVYGFREAALHALLWPLHSVNPTLNVVYTGVGDMFFAYLKIAIYGGVALAIPVLCAQVWLFLRPALKAHERRNVGVILLLAPLLFYGGMAFAWGAVMPLAIQFFLGFANADVAAMPTLDAYMSFTLKMLLAFGLTFLAPAGMLVCIHMGVVRAATFATYRRHTIVGIFIVAAVLTPPDPLSQLLLAVPLLVLFEGTLLLAKIVHQP
ncbi:MAG: twin-arginine translocase subunit TatC [Alphaproteobacteria bacterium]